jgi:putative addiction module killer protein
MNTILQTAAFSKWLLRLKDNLGKARIIERIRAAERGNFGDSKFLGDRVWEMRIHSGSGYRVYYMRREMIVYLLLIGGSKATQQRDIKQAKAMAEKLERG